MKIDHVKSWTAGGVGIGGALFFALMLAIAAVGAKAGGTGPWSQPSIPDAVRTVNGPGKMASGSAGASARASTARAAAVLGVRTPLSGQPVIIAEESQPGDPTQTPTDQVAPEPEQEKPVQPNDPTQPDTQTPPTPPAPPVPTPTPQTPTPLPTPQPSPTDPSESPTPSPPPPANAPAPPPPGNADDDDDDKDDDKAANPNNGNGKGGKESGQGGKPKKKD